MEHVRQGTLLSRLLQWSEQREASDLHVQAGRPLRVRIHGRLSPLPDEVSPGLGAEQVYAMLRECFSPRTSQRIEEEHEVDLSFYHGEVRYRANFSKQMGAQAGSFRTVPQQRLKLADLQLPPTLLDLIKEPRGLMLVTGPTGQGKSTTLRALIQEISETQAVRIITIEDPIEYVFDECLAQIEQREVGIDTESFADGIRNAMRQDPNVIFIGEIRDRESIHAAMQAAETGHLVLTTLHADSAAQAIGRIREYYPSSEQSNISSLLARNLNSILCQRLLPNVQGTRTPCLEVMRRDAGVQEAIAQNNLHLLTGIVEASVNQGMHTFDQYLLELLAAGLVSEETARHFAVNRHKLDLALAGIVTTTPILVRDEAR
ncbi:MAG: PilT/PilU family type 4a pilus ATPase [Verrucomicrobia bacterium]|nr:PilT/PilU family type 4a pilus ATPase [Verrucomicrobiota bacterium]